MSVKYTVIRKNIKKANIKVSINCKVTITVPLYYSEEYIHQLVEEKKSWIIKQLARMEEKNKSKLVAPSGSIIYLGEIYTLQRNIAMGRFYSIDKENKVIISGQDFEDLKICAKFYRDQANIIIPARVNRMAKEHGFNFEKTIVRTTKRTWGTCRGKKIITMNKRLILAPIFVIDAVALHELVHTEISKHSQKFYDRLQQVCPNYKDADKWLETYFPTEYIPF